MQEIEDVVEGVEGEEEEEEDADGVIYILSTILNKWVSLQVVYQLLRLNITI